MSRYRLAAVAIVVPVAVAGAVVALPSAGWLDRGSDVPVFEVRRRTFVKTVRAEGHLRAVHATPVTAPIEARGSMMIAWLADDGTRVKSGEVIVRFDPTEMERNLQDGKADLSTAKHKITKTELEGDSRLSSLARDAELAELELDYAERFQSKDPEIFSRTEIIESGIDRDLALERKEKAEASRPVRGELSRADVELLRIEQRKAKIKIGEAEQGLGALEVRAPHDGILVFKRDWRGEIPQVGQTVWSGYPLAEIPSLDEMEAEVFVLEADGGDLREGLAATVAVDSRPTQAFPAIVKTVDALAKPRRRGSPVQYFGVVLELEDTDPEFMKPGQRVTALLTVRESADVLVVPRQAVFEEDSEKVVYRRSSTGFEPVRVSLGPSTPGRVVVESGIEEGDVIALSDPEDTRDAGEGAGGGGSPLDLR